MSIFCDRFCAHIKAIIITLTFSFCSFSHCYDVFDRDRDFCDFMQFDEYFEKSIDEMSLVEFVEYLFLFKQQIEARGYQSPTMEDISEYVRDSFEFASDYEFEEIDEFQEEINKHLGIAKKEKKYRSKKAKKKRHRKTLFGMFKCFVGALFWCIPDGGRGARIAGTAFMVSGTVDCLNAGAHDY